MGDSLQDLKQRTDIVDLIGQTVTLKKEGSNFKGLCPLHHDQKTPSLTVYPSTRAWHCFGCNKGGDVITWIEELHHLDFKGAKAKLEGNTTRGVPKETVYAIREYTGELIAEHVRQDLNGTKRFIWRRDGKDSLGGLKTQDLPLYNMPDFLAAEPGADVILTEGEKARDSLHAKGILSLGTVCGASICPSASVLTPLIGSRRVYLWPDNDAPGIAHMERIARELKKLGIEAWMIHWPEAPPKGDAADYHGDIKPLLDSAKIWAPTGAASGLVAL